MKRFRAAASCLTAPCIQPRAASWINSVGSAAKTVEQAAKNKRVAALFISVSSRLSKFVHQVGLACHVGQTEISAQVRISQLQVIQTKQTQNARMDVVQMDGIAHGTQSKFVRGPD